MAQTTYRIDIYNKDFSSKLTTIVFPIIRAVNLRLNEQTTALFEVPKSEPQAVSTYLKEMNRVKILRWSAARQDHVPIWAGAIESIREGDETWQVGCVDILTLLDYRLTSGSRNMNGVAPDEIYELLDAINGDDDTGVIQGTSDLSNNINLTYQYKSFYDVVDEIVGTKLGGEYRISPSSLELDLMTSIGEDVSEIVTFIRNDNNPPSSNLSDAKIQTQAKELYNYVIARGKTGGGSTITQIVSDATSIAANGRREIQKTFDSVRSSGELLDLATAFLNEHKDPLVDLDISPEPARYVQNVVGDMVKKGYDFSDDYGVGDLVTIKYVTPFKTVERVERVVEVRISVDSAGNESITLKTTSEDQKLIAEIVDRSAQKELKNRVQNVENQLYP